MIEDIISMHVIIKEKDFITVSIRHYYSDKPQYGTRNLSPSNKDRFAIDFGKYSLILEMWFISNMNRRHNDG